MAIYIDIGSSTVKVYKSSDKGLALLGTKSFHFKEGFAPAKGIIKANKDELIDYVKDIKKKHDGETIKVFATALFRKMTLLAKRKLSDDFFRETGLYFNIVSHELEGFYLEKALSSEYVSDTPILLINIGGGSTELIVKLHGEVLERYYLEIGVGSVLEEFPRLNENYSGHSLIQVVNAIKKLLPQSSIETPVAIYNGGELTYMRLVRYNLRPNDIFQDYDHPYFIIPKDFAIKNQEVYEHISLKELELLMPSDPLWMHGARACSAIAQAIIEHFSVKKLVPSDLNMIHGTAKQEYRTVVLSGSFRKHLPYILAIKQKLSSQRVEILSPRFEDSKNPGEEFVVFEGEEGMSPLELERYHLDMINDCDALVVCASGGYVGASALIEIGYAHALGKRIIFTEQPEEFMLQTLPSEVGM